MTQNRDKNLIQVITLYHHPTIHPPTSMTSTSDWWSVGFAVEWWMMYLGSSVDLLASYSFSAIRSSCTKCVELDEVGKVLALLYSVESIIPIFMTQVRWPDHAVTVRQFIIIHPPDLRQFVEGDISSAWHWRNSLGWLFLLPLRQFNSLRISPVYDGLVETEGKRHQWSGK